MGDKDEKITSKDYWKAAAITMLGWVVLGIMYVAYAHFSV